VLGEIGGNDYNFWFAARRPREQANQFIPDIVATIGSAAQVRCAACCLDFVPSSSYKS
jgi:hypothetical protein